MSPLRFWLIGFGLIAVAFGFLWLVGPLPTPEFDLAYYFPAAIFVAFTFVSLFGAGIFAVVRGFWLIMGREPPKRYLPRIFPELPLRNVTAWNKRGPSRSLNPAMLNAFSVSWICVLMSQVILFMAFQPEPWQGLWIVWEKRSHISAVESPWSDTMSVYVRSPGQFFVNGEAVARERFEGTLREKLGHRVEWTVYVEADADTRFMDTVYAIDTIQGLGGKVVWITPRTRAEWNEEHSSPGFPSSTISRP